MLPITIQLHPDKRCHNYSATERIDSPIRESEKEKPHKTSNMTNKVLLNKILT